MVWTRAVFAQRLQMKCGGIAHVSIKAILGIAGVQSKHAGVASRLGENRRRGNGRDFAIAADDRCDRTRQPRAMRAIDQGVAGGNRAVRAGECRDRALHGEQAGLQDVDSVDLLDAGLGDCPGQRRGAYFGSKNVPFSGRKLL